MQIEIRFSNEEMKFMKRFLYRIPRFKKWYLRHWRSVFGCQWVDSDGHRHRPQHAPDVFIWWPKQYPKPKGGENNNG